MSESRPRRSERVIKDRLIRFENCLPRSRLVLCLGVALPSFRTGASFDLRPIVPGRTAPCCPAARVGRRAAGAWHRGLRCQGGGRSRRSSGTGGDRRSGDEGHSDGGLDDGRPGPGSHSRSETRSETRSASEPSPHRTAATATATAFPARRSTADSAAAGCSSASRTGDFGDDRAPRLSPPRVATTSSQRAPDTHASPAAEFASLGGGSREAERASGGSGLPRHRVAGIPVERLDDGSRAAAGNRFAALSRRRDLACIRPLASGRCRFARAPRRSGCGRLWRGRNRLCLVLRRSSGSLGKRGHA
jgi:hypothetical protein